jgi:small-conductance mechanosensitive channel
MLTVDWWPSIAEEARRLITVIFILVGGYALVRSLNWLLRRYIRKKTEELNVDDATRFGFLRHLLNRLLYAAVAVLVIYQFPALRGVAWSLTAGAGVFAAILGFASQQAFSNIISGLFIVSFKPFRVHDRVKIGDKFFGDIEDINLRHTVIRNFENQRIIIPNSVISAETIVNATIVDQRTIRYVDMTVGLEADAERAIEIMRQEIENHPLWIDARTSAGVARGEPKTYIKVVGFNEYGVQIRAYAWAASPPDAWELGTDLNLSIKKRFQAEGIEIPYPYRNVIIKDAPRASAFDSGESGFAGMPAHQNNGGAQSS